MARSMYRNPNGAVGSLLRSSPSGYIAPVDELLARRITLADLHFKDEIAKMTGFGVPQERRLESVKQQLELHFEPKTVAGG